MSDDLNNSLEKEGSAVVKVRAEDMTVSRMREVILFVINTE